MHETSTKYCQYYFNHLWHAFAVTRYLYTMYYVYTCCTAGYGYRMHALYTVWPLCVLVVSGQLQFRWIKYRCAHCTVLYMNDQVAKMWSCVVFSLLLTCSFSRLGLALQCDVGSPRKDCGEIENPPNHSMTDKSSDTARDLYMYWLYRLFRHHWRAVRG